MISIPYNASHAVGTASSEIQSEKGERHVVEIHNQFGVVVRGGFIALAALGLGLWSTVNGFICIGVGIVGVGMVLFYDPVMLERKPDP